MMSCFLAHSVDCEFVAYLFKIRKNSFGHILLNTVLKNLSLQVSS